MIGNNGKCNRTWQVATFHPYISTLNILFSVKGVGDTICEMQVNLTVDYFPTHFFLLSMYGECDRTWHFLSIYQYPFSHAFISGKIIVH